MSTAMDEIFADACRRIDGGMAKRGIAWGRFAFSPSASNEVITEIGHRLTVHYLAAGYKGVLDRQPAALDVKAEFRLTQKLP